MMLTKTLSEALGAFSRQEGVTLYMTLLTAFQTLLYRYTGQDDIVVGSPIAGRNRVEIEELIGFFVNTLVLRTDLSGNPTFRQLLGRVREVCLGAYAHQDHQDLPFEKLVEELQPERNLRYSPLFQVMFILQNAPRSALQLPGLTLSPLEVYSGTAKFDLTLSLVEEPEGLRGTLEYDTALFDAATITRMAGHYRTILEGVVANPDLRITELPMLTAAERHQLLVEWNDTQADYPRDKCIHHLFEKQVERTPDATALVFEDRQMTYGELNRRANQLAHHLQTLGVGPDVLVGIFVERSLEMMVALLGVLKAGGAYVPLDPAFPNERLTLMLEDAQVAVLLTQEDLIAILPETHGTVFCLDRDWERVAQQPESEPISEVSADHLTYVIYTSGSTGKPKGVQISHRALVNFLFSMMKEPGLTEQDVLLAVTTLSSDIAMLELFLPIITGARVVIVSSENALDGDRLLSRLTASGATVMQATPATWRLLLGTAWEGGDRLKILCGGEALPRDLATQLLERCASLWNMYGPTETTIWSTVNKVDDEKGPIFIGFPIANTQVYILDRYLHPVPVGVPGELHIGGDGLARGYLNRPELTAERFIANPFSDVSGSRLYKTGDLAKYLPDGSIEVLGRLDFQVKVRGFRIELGEIEAALEQNPKVRQAVTLVREDVPGDKQLVAYLIANDHQTPKIDILRNFLKEKLPDYMVPASFVMMEQMPLTPNGKVDRKALPLPTGLRPDLDLAYVAPRNDLEQTISAIWQEVLKIEKIGIKDNFFDLGGHYLLAAQLFTKMKIKIGVNLPLAILFQAPTIEQLAGILSDKGWSASWSSLVAIKTTGSRLPFYCVHGAGGAVLELYPLASHLPPDQPFFGLQDPRFESGSIDELTIREMASHYIREMRSIQSEGPYIIGGYCFGATVAFEMAKQLEAQEEEVAAVIIIEGHRIDVKDHESAMEPTRLRRFINYVINRICLEKTNLSARETKEKLPYTRSRARRVIEKSWIKILIAFDPFLSGFNLRSRHSLPYKVEVLYKLHIKAQRNYEAKPYSGRVIIFKAMQKSFGISSDPYLGWGRLINRESEVCEVPSLHENIINEPWVKVLAEKLNDSLERLNHGR
jgi:amino acid adenylation domain-containing protein